MSHITKDDLGNPSKQSRKLEWTRCLQVHLAIFMEIYRQPVSKIAADAYFTHLAGLSVEQLDAACKRALQTSEFLPVPATILRCH